MTTIKIEGMNCEHCVFAVEGALGRVDGVTAVKVDLSSGIVTFSEEKPVNMADVKQVIEEAGYAMAQ